MEAVRSRRDALVAGLVAAAASGVPSTAWTLARGGDVLAGAKAAGAIVLRREQRTAPLLAAAVPVHLALSLGWALALGAALPARRERLYGTAAGLAIAALDLVVIGRRIPAVRELEQFPQWLDHAAYGFTIGTVLRRAHAARAPAEVPRALSREP